MFGISGAEFAVIVVIAMLAVGPKQMPQVLRASGRAYRKLNRFIKKMSQVIDDIMYDADKIADKAERALNGQNGQNADGKQGKADDE